jgi:hypothetical protein
MNYRKYMKDLANYQAIQGEYEEEDLLVAA